MLPDLLQKMGFETAPPAHRRPRLGVSACLLGRPVRYDGGHRDEPLLHRELGPLVRFVEVCPEVAIGLPVPRPPIQVVTLDGEQRVRGVARPDQDHTDALGAQARNIDTPLDGFVFKKDSPSCGVFRGRVRAEKGGMPVRTGVGHFSRVVMDNRPELPVEEEGRLHDPYLRESFIEALFCHNRWRVLVARGLTRRALVEFHEAHKMLLLAHDVARYRALGPIVGSFGRVPDDEVYRDYAAHFLAAIRRPASVGRHVNVLEHLFGHLKNALTPREKKEIGLAIDDFRSGRIPLVVPIALLRFLVTSHEADYVGGQLYLEPHPREMMLRNHC